MSKYLKISVVFTALYIVLAILLSALDSYLNYGIGLFGVGFWATAAENAVFLIPYWGMILAALISAITGLVAAYKVIRTKEKWWYVITIFGTVNAVLVFGMAFSMLIT